MAVQVIGSRWITSDQTQHQAISLDDDKWAVSYLPGQHFSLEQAVSAIRVAEEVMPVILAVGGLAAELGMTAFEALSLASVPCEWAAPPPLPSAGPRWSRWFR